MVETLKYTLCKVIQKGLFSLIFFPQYYAKVLDYRAVGLSSRRTIDTHPYGPWASIFKYWNKCICTLYISIHVLRRS